MRSQILDCELCLLHENCETPTPFDGPSGSIVVIGEAPTPVDQRAGKPFAESFLREMTESVGLPPIFWMNVVSCVAGRRPFEWEVNACSANRDLQLSLADSRTVVLAGNVPLQVYRPDLRIGRAHGRPIVMGETVLFPIYNPAAAERNPAWKQDIEADLSLLKLMLDSGDWQTAFNEECIWCNNHVDRLDQNCVPYCSRHWATR